MAKKALLDHYAVLEVSADADRKTIDAAYWRLARESATGTRGALADLNAAYELLGTPVLRHEYDVGRMASPRESLILRPERNIRPPEKRQPETPPKTKPQSRAPQQFEVLPVAADAAPEAPKEQRAYVDALQVQIRHSRAALRERLASVPVSAEDAGRSPLQRIFGRARATSANAEGLSTPASTAANHVLDRTEDAVSSSTVRS